MLTLQIFYQEILYFLNKISDGGKAAQFNRKDLGGTDPTLP